MATLPKWFGKSGQSYEFETFPVGTRFNHVSGVYVACKALSTGVFEPLYVGEAESLHNRLNVEFEKHEGLQRASRLGMTHIEVMLVSGKTNRLRIETDLRHGLDPVCNRQPVPNRALSLADALRYTNP
jgi:hypothetical protein